MIMVLKVLLGLDGGSFCRPPGGIVGVDAADPGRGSFCFDLGATAAVSVFAVLGAQVLVLDRR
jgi:hypothetical protein